MSVHDIVANTLIKEMETSEAWLKEWVTVDNQNFKTRTSYHGINRLLLGMSKRKNKFNSNYWLTWNQSKELNGSVKAGSKSTMAVFWLNEWERKNEEGQKEIIEMPVMRFYRLFNLDQVDGIDEPEIINSNTPIEAAELIAKNYQDCPKILSDNHAYYMPSQDLIGIPELKLFNSPEAYYSTLFHEMTHSTGHEKRLNRDLDNVKGDGEYAKEELIAEMGAAFLCSDCGIVQNTMKNSAAYLKGWIKRIKDDNKILFRTTAQAEKAVSYIKRPIEKLAIGKGAISC